MDQIITIKIAKDFTEFPGARYKTDGDKSGEEFYDTILGPKYKEALEGNMKILLDLDGTWGYASSFISEIITRLVNEYKDKEKIMQIVTFKSDDEPLLIDSIQRILKSVDVS